MHFLVGVCCKVLSIAAYEDTSAKSLHEHHIEAKDTGIKSAFLVFALIHPYLLQAVAMSGTNNESQAPSSAFLFPAPFSSLSLQIANAGVAWPFSSSVLVPPSG